MIANLGKLKIQGRQFDHWLDDSGQFCARFDEHQTLSHKTLDGLKDALKRRLASKPLGIEILFLSDRWDASAEPKLKKGTIVSKHSANNNWIVKWAESNRTEQLRRWDGKILQAGTDENRLKALAKAAHQARETYESFLRENEADLSAAGADDKG